LAIEDRRILIVFLGGLRIVIIDVVNERTRLIRPPMLLLFQNAWPDIDRAFTLVATQLENDALDASLTGAGLTGTQLALKMGGYGRALERWLRKKGRRTLRGFLSWADTILDSLVSVLPAAEIIREYKECLVNEAETGRT